MFKIQSLLYIDSFQDFGAYASLESFATLKNTPFGVCIFLDGMSPYIESFRDNYKNDLRLEGKVQWFSSPERKGPIVALNHFFSQISDQCEYFFFWRAKDVLLWPLPWKEIQDIIEDNQKSSRIEFNHYCYNWTDILLTTELQTDYFALYKIKDLRTLLEKNKKVVFDFFLSSYFYYSINNNCKSYSCQFLANFSLIPTDNRYLYNKDQSSYNEIIFYIDKIRSELPTAFHIMISNIQWQQYLLSVVNRCLFLIRSNILAPSFNNEYVQFFSYWKWFIEYNISFNRQFYFTLSKPKNRIKKLLIFIKKKLKKILVKLGIFKKLKNFKALVGENLEELKILIGFIFNIKGLRKLGIKKDILISFLLKIPRIPFLSKSVFLRFYPPKTYHALVGSQIAEYVHSNINDKISYVKMGILRPTENFGDALRNTPFSSISGFRYLLSLPSDKYLIIFNDWGFNKKVLDKIHSIGSTISIASMEGIIYTPISWSKYQTASVLFSTSPALLPFLGRSHNVYQVSNSSIENLYNKYFPLPKKPKALINLSFSYGVGNHYSYLFLYSAIYACEMAEIDYHISLHPQASDVIDNPKILEKVTKNDVYQAIADSTIIISRFSMVVFESMAMGRSVIYFNPHEEKEILYQEVLEYIKSCHSSHHLSEFLKKHIKTLPEVDFLKNQFQQVLKNFCGLGYPNLVESVGNYIKENKKPIFISFIIPHHSSSRLDLLEECINSILAQNFLNDPIIEIILITSYDNTSWLKEKYAQLLENDRFYLIIDTVKTALPMKRNIGLEKAMGHYIVFLDDDDYIAYNYVHTMKRMIKKYGFLDILIPKISNNFNSGGKKYSKKKLIPRTYNINNHFYSIIVTLRPIRKDFLKNHDIFFNEEHQKFEDQLFNFKILLSSPRCIYVNNTSVFVRRHSESITFGHVKGLKEWFIIVSNDIIEFNPLEGRKYIPLFFNSQKNLSHMFSEQKEEFIEYISDISDYLFKIDNLN